MIGHGSQMQKTLFEVWGHDVPQGTSLGGQGGRVSIDTSPCPPRVPREGDPAARWASKAARRAAWEAWEKSGAGLDDLPAGLVSASLDQCLNHGRHRQGWKR